MGARLVGLVGLGLLRLPGLAPLGTILDNPVSQCPLEPNIITGLFRLDPFVFQNLFALGLKLAVERGIFYKIVRRGIRSVTHNTKD